MKPVPSSRGARSIGRIVDAAARLFGRNGYEAASMGAVARAAGVSKGLLHYHFDSKEHLLIEAVRATFRQLHARFDDRFQRGDRGLETVVEALDALWGTVRDMSSWAPFMVETMSLATKSAPLHEDLAAFYDETTALLEGGIREAFAGAPPLPADRLARLVRVTLHGLVVELAQAQTEAERERVVESYADLRDLFVRVAREPGREALP
ncbi:MAG: helix-turn-helix domain-containing protein [Myxococcota bacterium]